MDIVFHCIIKPALAHKYEVLRGDHVARPGRITEQIVESIIDNDLIVCVLTGNNPNVYYELAIAESAARPIIVLRHSGDEIPFDVKDVRFIEYDLEPRRIYDKYYIGLLQEAEEYLFAHDQTISKVPFAPYLTPLGRQRLNFRMEERYDLLSRQVPDILSSAEQRFDFMGISLRGWIGNEGFLSLLKEKANTGLECRFLLMSESNASISQMFSIASQEARIKKDIQASFMALSELRSLTKTLEVRLVERGIIYQQMSQSEKSMIWAPHLFSKQTGESPAARVDVGKSPSRKSGLDSLYEAMRGEFARLWHENPGFND